MNRLLARLYRSYLWATIPAAPLSLRLYSHGWAGTKRISCWQDVALLVRLQTLRSPEDSL